ncbi:MAG: DNA polymerase III subunit delta [Novosphingobium sp.]|nr:DNA polymerase III subunit delta [Novosphingobium sp.]
MKATQRDFARLAPQAARDAQLFFFCGPDEAGAWAALETIVSMLPDPGERIELSGADLKRDPVRLGDEARSNSLFGDARHIAVRASGEEAHDALEVMLSSDVEACPVLIVATGATDKSRSAKLIANRPDALVGMFYPPDLASIAHTIRGLGDELGLSMDTATAQRIAGGAGLDIRLARSEVEKLALYLDADPKSPRQLSREALDAVGAASEDDSFAPLVDTVLGGDTRSLASEIRRYRELGINPVAVLLAMERRAAQLASLAAKLGPRGDVDSLVESEKKRGRLFFKDAPAIKSQLARWRGRRLERLVDRLAGLHHALLSNSGDAELLLAQGMAEIARAASAK